MRRRGVRLAGLAALLLTGCEGWWPTSGDQTITLTGGDVIVNGPLGPTPTPAMTPGALGFGCMVTDGGSSVTCVWNDQLNHTVCLTEAPSFRACSPSQPSGTAFDAEESGPARTVTPTLEEGGQVLATAPSVRTET